MVAPWTSLVPLRRMVLPAYVSCGTVASVGTHGTVLTVGGAACATTGRTSEMPNARSSVARGIDPQNFLIHTSESVRFFATSSLACCCIHYFASIFPAQESASARGEARRHQYQ